MCTPSGRAMKGRRCHDVGIMSGEDLEESLVVGEDGGERVSAASGG